MARPSLLIVEADPFLRMDAAAIAVGAGFQTFEAMDGATARAFLAQGRPIDAIVLGANANGAIDNVLLGHLAAYNPRLNVIVIRSGADLHDLPGAVISIQNVYFEMALKITLRTILQKRPENLS